MAFSSSFKSAQAIKICEVCNEDNIKWRCINCEMCFCEKCKTFHLKIPVTAEHQFVTMETSKQDVDRRKITNNIPCKKHVTKMNCLFCKTCDLLVCPECVANSHTQHQFIQIENSLDDKLERMRVMLANVDTRLKFCDSKALETQNLMAEYNVIFDESVSKIKQREQELTEAICKISNVLQEKVEKERVKMKTSVNKINQQIDGAKKKLTDRKEKFKAALTSNQGRVIFDVSSTDQGPMQKFDKLPNKAESFIPAENKTTQIKRLLGSFQKVKLPTVPSVFEFTVLTTFTTDLSTVKQVIPSNETSAWINGTRSTISIIREVSFQHNNIDISYANSSFEVDNIALTLEKDILLTEYNKLDVKLITSLNEIKSFLKVKPSGPNDLVPCGIHVTCDNEVIIGIRDRSSVLMLTEESQRSLVVLNRNGKQKQRFEYDKEGKRLFTYPYKITTNKNRDIFINDLVSFHSGRVVALDRKGRLKWIYEGHSEFNTTNQFHPWNITTTSDGYIVVSDCRTHSLHVLSENGQVLTCKNMCDIGISYPRALNMDKRGNLWVGCDSCDDKGAKLHIVQLLI